MDTPAARSTTTRPTLRRVATVLALAAGLGLAAPAAADAASVRTVPGVSAVATKRPAVLKRIAVIRTDIGRAKVAANRAGLPPAQATARTRVLTTAQATLTAASRYAGSARTVGQLERASLLAEQVAPQALPSAPEVLARGNAVLDTVAVLRPDLEGLDVRASLGESNGFDVSAWADPVRAGLPKALDAETLATRVVGTVTSTGVVAPQDVTDLAAAEARSAEAATLTTAAHDALAAANGS